MKKNNNPKVQLIVNHKRVKKFENNDIEVDVRSPHSLYVTIGDWIVYLDNGTDEKIVTKFTKREARKILDEEKFQKEILGVNKYYALREKKYSK